MAANRTRVWFSLFILAVFCLGLALGLMLGRRMGPPAFAGAGVFNGPAGGRGGPGPRGPRLLIERLDRELQLTDDQKQRVQSIFDARRPQLEAMQRDLAVRAEEEQRALQADVRKVLTPEQQVKFDRWLEQQPRGRRGRPPF